MGGLATFYEQDNERWLNRTQSSEGVGFSNPFADQIPNVDEARTAYFYAETSGLPLTEYTVLLDGDALDFSIRETNGDLLNKSLEIVTELDGNILIKKDEAQYTFTPQRQGNYKVTFKSGHYEKTFEFNVIEKMNPEEIPSLDDTFTELIKSTDQQYESFRNQLATHKSKLLSLNMAPRFADGLIEYYLGLKHESDGVSQFGDRYERAACLLLPYVAYSRLASFVVHYFAFRINGWSLFGEDPLFPNLFSAAQFFKREFQAKKNHTEKHISSLKSRRPLLINETDDLCIKSVQLLESGNLEGAQSHVYKALDASTRQAQDAQRDARLELLQARIARRMGNQDLAQKHYLNLASSPTPNWAEEAKLYLSL